MTYETAASTLKVGVPFIERLVRTGKIRAGTATRTVDRADVHRYARRRAVRRAAANDAVAALTEVGISY
jgi:excisionase family DNA binding protein